MCTDPHREDICIEVKRHQCITTSKDAVVVEVVGMVTATIMATGMATATGLDATESPDVKSVAGGGTGEDISIAAVTRKGRSVTGPLAAPAAAAAAAIPIRRRRRRSNLEGLPVSALHNVWIENILCLM